MVLFSVGLDGGGEKPESLSFFCVVVPVFAHFTGNPRHILRLCGALIGIICRNL